VGLPAEAAHRVFDRPGAAHRVVVGRHPALVCGPLPVSFVCGGLALVGQPLTFVGVPLALIGQPFTFVGVLVAPGPSLPTRLAGAGTLIGGPSTLNRLVGWTGRISRAFLVVQMALLGRVGDASALLVTDGTAGPPSAPQLEVAHGGGPGPWAQYPGAAARCVWLHLFGRVPPGSHEGMPSPRPSLESYRWRGGSP
jgi:hypothetical protein